VANRPIYVAVGITLAGERDVLGMWVGTGGEGAKGWMNHLSDLKNRGVEDILIVACDGLKGLPDAITALWPRAEVQLCVVHLFSELGGWPGAECSSVYVSVVWVRPTSSVSCGMPRWVVVERVASSSCFWSAPARLTVRPSISPSQPYLRLMSVIFVVAAASGWMQGVVLCSIQQTSSVSPPAASKP